MDKLSTTLLIPHLNRDLLGDKIVLSALIAASIQHNPDAVVWGVEGNEDMRMRFYARQPNRVLCGEVVSLVSATARRLKETNNKYILKLYVDANSTPTEELEVLANTEVFDLWDSLKEAKKDAIFPRLVVRDAWVRQARKRILECFGEPLPDRFIAIHIRQLERQPWKNSDLALIESLAARVQQELAAGVILIGRGDQRRSIEMPGVVDLGNEAMQLGEVAGLLSLVSLYIGGDSGPTHLAGAVGCPIIGVGYSTERFGPFVPASQLLGLYGEFSGGNIRRVDVVEVTELIAQSLGGKRNLRRMDASSQ